MNIVNGVMALTNIFALPAIYTIHTSPIQNWIAIMVMISSTLMHLSERKHNLPGIYPFNVKSQLWLNLDRIVSIIGVLYMTYKNLYVVNYWIAGTIGLMSLFVSEFFSEGVIIYVFFHVYWHIIVYYILFVF